MSGMATDFDRRDALSASRRQESSPADFGESQQANENSTFKRRAQEKMLEAALYGIDKKLRRKNDLNEARREDSKSQEHSAEGDGYSKKNENGQLRFDEIKKIGKYGRELAKIAVEAEEGREFKSLVDAIKLARELRKDVKDHYAAPWLIAITVAIVSDIDPTGIIGLPTKVFLFFFLWGKGRLKYRIIRYILITFELMPIVGYLPMSIGAVLFCWHESNEKRKKSSEKLEKLKSIFGEKLGK